MGGWGFCTGFGWMIDFGRRKCFPLNSAGSVILREAKVLSVEFRGIGFPDGVKHLQEFISPPGTGLHRSARRVELVLRPALAEAHAQPATGEDVKCRKVTSEHDRVVIRHVENARAKADAARVSCRVSESTQWVELNLVGFRKGAI